MRYRGDLERNRKSRSGFPAESEEDMTDILNKQIELLFQYWDGKITEEEFENNKLFSISKEVDAEMQQDRFY